LITDIIKSALDQKASDIHLTEGLPPVFRINGRLAVQRQFDVFSAGALAETAKQLLGENYENYGQKRSFDFSFHAEGRRFRGHVFKQRGADAVVLRVIPAEVPTVDQLLLPESVKKFTSLKDGLVLVTGPTGSGKSTTLAALINEINRTQEKHIITIEDPVEFIHPHRRCIVNQREVGTDVANFADAVRSAMREDPDILLVGEMRDLETIQNAITMAETGHLVFATLHTRSAAETIDRIIDVFPPVQQQQIRVQLSSILQGIISQCLVPAVSGGRVPVCEVMFATDGIKSIIKENGPHSSIKDQILLNHRKLGSCTYEQSLAALYKRGLIDRDTALEHAKDIETFKRMVQR